ncbi:rna-directed dna polymerase from mobile element jockey-like [Limosa lapponica baueri]|uniref:Rna-directed dna polymerase from mobile element jockey-like n=1 Tax=Limosa lapponica baueri TaxID=1758121 RepID=A0A2I0U944_LIMLA|nr:rna-directed dna polymerase from mobile element jockey-like [Limosa lapponica baueri]
MTYTHPWTIDTMLKAEPAVKLLHVTQCLDNSTSWSLQNTPTPKLWVWGPKYKKAISKIKGVARFGFLCKCFRHSSPQPPPRETDALWSRQVSVWWLGNWLTGHTQRVVVNSSFSNWQPVTSGVPQGPILGPRLFNSFISDLDAGIKRTLTKFAADMKMNGEVDTLEGRATLQEDLNRLEEWANKNIIKFHKDKCKVLHLGKCNPSVQHRLASTWLGSNSVERDLGIPVDRNLVRSEQCAAVAKKASSMLGCNISREKSLSHSTQHLSGHTWSAMFSSAKKVLEFMACINLKLPGRNWRRKEKEKEKGKHVSSGQVRRAVIGSPDKHPLGILFNTPSGDDNEDDEE